jgi:hypothetical protein
MKLAEETRVGTSDRRQKLEWPARKQRLRPRTGSRNLAALMQTPSSEAVLLLIITLVARVILIGIVVLVGGVKLLPLGAIGDEVSGVTILETAPGDLLLSLWNLCKAQNFLASKAISSSGMLSYCSSEVIAKEDKANSKEDETALMGLASWPTTQELVTKSLLVKEALWLGRPLRDSSWDLILLNIFSMSKVAKSADSSKAVIFIPHTWSSRAYNNYLACSLSV